MSYGMDLATYVFLQMRTLSKDAPQHLRWHHLEDIT